MENRNIEQKKEMKLYGIAFWLLAAVDVCHITIGTLYSAGNEVMLITLMTYKAATALLKVYLGARIIRQVKSNETAVKIRPQFLRVVLGAFAISLLLDIFYCFLVSDLVYGLIEVCNSSIAFIPLLGCRRNTEYEGWL